MILAKIYFNWIGKISHLGAHKNALQLSEQYNIGSCDGAAATSQLMKCLFSQKRTLRQIYAETRISTCFHTNTYTDSHVSWVVINRQLLLEYSLGCVCRLQSSIWYFNMKWFSGNQSIPSRNILICNGQSSLYRYNIFYRILRTIFDQRILLWIG